MMLQPSSMANIGHCKILPQQICRWAHRLEVPFLAKKIVKIEVTFLREPVRNRMVTRDVAALSNCTHIFTIFVVNKDATNTDKRQRAVWNLRCECHSLGETMKNGFGNWYCNRL